jgi:hypothetical protein
VQSPARTSAHSEEETVEELQRRHLAFGVDAGKVAFPLPGSSTVGHHDGEQKQILLTAVLERFS